MTSVEIEYCHPCGFLDRAQDVQQAVLENLGQNLEEVSLVVGHNGILQVRVDGDVVFDKDEDEYDVDAIVGSVRQQVRAEA